jgi:hypothetical protein
MSRHYRVIHNNLEPQYPCSNVFHLQSDSKLFSGFPEGLVNFSVLFLLTSYSHNSDVTCIEVSTRYSVVKAHEFSDSVLDDRQTKILMRENLSAQ